MMPRPECGGVFLHADQRLRCQQVNYAPLVGGTVIPQLDDYTDDSLNRVKSVKEAQMNSGGGWTFNVFRQTFDYDRWGNRTINLDATTAGVAGVTRKNFAVDTATNRLTAVDGVGMTYDAVGNQTNDEHWTWAKFGIAHHPAR